MIIQITKTNTQCIQNAPICDLCIKCRTALKPEERSKVSQVFIGALFDLSAYEQYAIPYR